MLELIKSIIHKYISDIESFENEGSHCVINQRRFRKIIEFHREGAMRGASHTSLVLFQLANTHDKQDVELLINTIKNKQRKNDRVGWYEKGTLGVLLTYTDSDGAKKWVEKLSDVLVSKSLHCHIDCHTLPVKDNLEP